MSCFALKAANEIAIRFASDPVEIYVPIIKQIILKYLRENEEEQNKWLLNRKLKGLP